MDLYPINPQTLARYRKAFYTSGAKDDPMDGQLLEDLLRSHPDRLRIYQPAPELERKLELFCEQRRKVVGLAVKLENQLRSTLKEYYPLAIDLCAPAALRTSLALDFLQRWPTFDSLKKARPETLRSRCHGSSRFRMLWSPVGECTTSCGRVDAEWRARRPWRWVCSGNEFRPATVWRIRATSRAGSGMRFG